MNKWIACACVICALLITGIVCLDVLELQYEQKDIIGEIIGWSVTEDTTTLFLDTGDAVKADGQLTTILGINLRFIVKEDKLTGDLYLIGIEKLYGY